VRLEPNSGTNEDYDFSCVGKNKQLLCVEVKTASWKQQVIKNDKKITKREKKRIIQPKYINGEGGSYSSDENIKIALVKSIEQAIAKFRRENDNILVVVDNQSPYILDSFLSFSQLKKSILDCVNQVDKNKLLNQVYIMSVGNCYDVLQSCRVDILSGIMQLAEGKKILYVK